MTAIPPASTNSDHLVVRRNLRDRLVDPDPARLRLRQGVCTAVSISTGTCTITLGADTTSLAGVCYLDGAMPNVGDTVWVLRDGPSLLVVGSQTSPAWTAATLAGTWSNLGGFGFAPAGYYRDATGTVHLRGVVAAGGAATIFTLPAGYRPGANMVFGCIANGALHQVNVNTAGVVSDGTGLPPNLALDVITFRAFS
jgi:hypothetical protein